MGSRFLLILMLISLSSPLSGRGQIVESSQVGRFQLAESFLRAAQFERAISLLEGLFEESPGTHVFYERLREAYENVKRYDAAIALVEAKIQSETASTSYISEKARLLFLKGDEATAKISWQAAIDSNPGSPSVYLLVYRSLMQIRLFDFAIEILEQGREKLDNTALFQTDLAQLYSLTSQHGRAIGQYLELLKINQNQLNYVKTQLGQFLINDQSIAESVGVAEKGVANEPLNRSYRELLAWLYIEAERFRDAFVVYQAVDRLEREEGRMLFSFAQVAADGGVYDVALEAFDEVLRRYPEAESAPDAMRGLGLMQEMWAEALGEQVFDLSGTRSPRNHYDEALDTYQRFLIEYPQHAYFPDVLQRIGVLHQDIFFDFVSAASVLMEVISRYPGTQAANQAEYDLGRLAVTQNRLEDARIRFGRLLTRLRTGDLAELARYELAMLHFYQGDFVAAEGYTAVMQENTSTDVANDAIAMKVLLIESMGPDSLNTPLRRFARIKLLIRQRNWEVAIHQLEDLLNEFGGHSLADDMLFENAALQAMTGDISGAIQLYLELPLVHPTSFFGARSLFQAAQLQADQLDDKELAIRTYERILLEYPGSLLTTDTRSAIRVLRGDEV